MIYPTPTQSKGLYQLIEGSKNPQDWPIRKHYPGFETTFLLLHPFLRIKSGHEHLIKFETINWMDKDQITAHCELVTWYEFIIKCNIKDIGSLDRALAFYHRTTRFNDMEAYDKLESGLKDGCLIPPQVDNFPVVLENAIFEYLKENGFNSLLCYSDTDDTKKLLTIAELRDAGGLPSNVRLESKNKHVLIIQDFDQRFSYVFGSKSLIHNLVESLDLEGFYCDDKTIEGWSFIPELHKQMNWSTGGQ